MPTTASLAPAAYPRLPVLVLAGQPGAGKTTLLNHLLRHGAGQRAAVIVSDEDSRAGLATLVTGRGALARTEEKAVRLASGAHAHELRADLLLEAGRLADENRFDYLLIENPGLADVAPVARTFSLAHAGYGLTLPLRARLDALVTVVDAGRFALALRAPLLPVAACPGEDHDYNHDPDAADHAPADVLIAQVEQANILVLNKTDQASSAELAWLRALLGQLNPGARLLTATFGQVSPADLLHTGLFADAAARPEPEAAPDLAAGGIGTFCFRDERPFHPERLWAFVRAGWPAAVLRSQGLFWLASRPDEVLSWSQAGASRRAGRAGTWWAAVPARERERTPAFRRDELALLARWHPQFQDRVNTLRFIGEDLDPARLRAELESCLCTPLEVGRWRRGAIFPDPWPQT